MGCGKYWSVDSRPVMCPYCADKYFVDNIDKNIPPPFTNIRVDFACGHALSCDLGADIKYCSECGSQNKDYKFEGTPLSLKDYQTEILDRLGI